MTLRTTLTLCAALWLAACECEAPSDLPSSLRSYGAGYDVSPTTEWTLDGYRFYRVTVLGADPPSTQIVALDDATGERVEGAALFALFADLPPEGLAPHACFTLLDGCTPLADADPRASAALGGDPSEVRAPRYDDDGRLVFDIVHAGATPEVTRIRVDVSGGRIASRQTLHAPEPRSEPVSIGATLGLSASPPSYVAATYTAGTPGAISGCISAVAGECFATTRVTLDEAAQAELTQLLAEVRAIPRCEPEAIQPGDLDYTVSWAGASGYAGSIPADEAQMSARNGGPCRADARLAWWLVRWVLATGRPPTEMPEPLVATFQRPDGDFANATVHFGRAPLSVVGCVSGARGSCRATLSVPLDDVQTARLRVLVEDVRAEPCHVPFPSAAPLAIEALGADDDTRCPADPALARWLGGLLTPAAP